MNSKGYTLIEIAVVVALIGIVLLLAVPAMRYALLNDDLQITINRITSTARTMRNDAVREQVDYILQFNIDGRTFWTYTADMTPEKRAEKKQAAFALPDGVKIVSISYPWEEKHIDGEISVTFYKSGVVQPAIIHLAQDERQATLIFEPFLSRIRIYNKYVEYPGIEEPESKS